jgi:hypothetical protein
MAGPLTVLNHYGTADLTERVDQALKQAGLDAGGLTWSDLRHSISSTFVGSPPQKSWRRV